MPGTKYRLTYFPIKGRAELIRVVFHAARVPFVDRRISFDQWKEFKSSEYGTQRLSEGITPVTQPLKVNTLNKNTGQAC